MKTNKNQNENETLITFVDGTLKLDVRVSPDEETVWLNQNEISKLYATSQQNVSLHIRNILKDDELSQSVHKEILYTADDGKQYKTKFYNFDMVLAIGYRIKSKRAIAFRKWVSNIMKDYLIKGYALNPSRAVISEKNYLDLCGDVLKLADKIDEHESRINHLMPSSTIIYDGTPVNASYLLSIMISSAKKKLTIVDPYFDLTGLLLIKDSVGKNDVTIVTSKRIKKDQIYLDHFIETYGNLNVVLDESIHDRFIILDDELIYQLGSSINQIGIKFSTINQILDKSKKQEILLKINQLIVLNNKKPSNI